MESEKPYGNIEYKLKLSDLSSERKEQLASQFLFRMNEGAGEAIYELGVSDDGRLLGLSETEMKESLNNLTQIAAKVNAEITVIRKSMGTNGYILEVLARRKPLESLPVSLTISLCGNVDAGKSTMLGSLISGQIDDGNGKVRELVMKHPHEINSGRTSSVSSKILGFNTHGKITNYISPELPLRKPEELLKYSSKMIRFVDLAGHEKYLKTTIFGISSAKPDYSGILISANAGILIMTKEHIGLNLVMKIPFFIVITKIDIAPPHIYENNMENIKKLLKSVGVSMIPYVIKSEDDISVASQRIGQRVVPIFPVSFVTGEGIEYLLKFLNLLPVRNKWSFDNQDILFFIDDIFNVPNIGIVVAGQVHSGTITADKELLIGPFFDGVFPVKIRSIQARRLPVKYATPGQYVTLALAIKEKRLERNIWKGQIITDKTNIKFTKKFIADIVILHHATTIKPGYCSQMHCQSNSQQVVLTEIIKGSSGKKFLRTSDTATVVLEFLYHSVYIEKDYQFILREGKSKGYGVIRELL